MPLAQHPGTLSYREFGRAWPRDVKYSWDGGDFVQWGRAPMSPAQRAWRLAGLARWDHRLRAAQRSGTELAHPAGPWPVIHRRWRLGFYIAENGHRRAPKLPSLSL